jgi:hypothetical protein
MASGVRVVASWLRRGGGHFVRLAGNCTDRFELARSSCRMSVCWVDGGVGLSPA